MKFYILLWRRPSHRNRQCEGNRPARASISADGVRLKGCAKAERPFIKNNKTRHDQTQQSTSCNGREVNQKFSRRRLSEKSSFCPLQALINRNFHFACFNQTNAKVHWNHLRVFASEKRWGAHDAGVVQRTLRIILCENEMEFEQFCFFTSAKKEAKFSSNVASARHRMEKARSLLTPPETHRLNSTTPPQHHFWTSAKFKHFSLAFQRKPSEPSRGFSTRYSYRRIRMFRVLYYSFERECRMFSSF